MKMAIVNKTRNIAAEKSCILLVVDDPTAV